jgi:hypothetical protein
MKGAGCLPCITCNPLHNLQCLADKGPNVRLAANPRAAPYPAHSQTFSLHLAPIKPHTPRPAPPRLPPRDEHIRAAFRACEEAAASSTTDATLPLLDVSPPDMWEQLEAVLKDRSKKAAVLIRVRHPLPLQRISVIEGGVLA